MTYKKNSLISSEYLKRERIAVDITLKCYERKAFKFL